MLNVNQMNLNSNGLLSDCFVIMVKVPVAIAVVQIIRSSNVMSIDVAIPLSAAINVTPLVIWQKIVKLKEFPVSHNKW